MSFETPPRGSGRHHHRWRDGNPISGFIPTARDSDEESYYPSEEDPTETNPGLYRVPQPGDADYEPEPVNRRPRSAVPTIRREIVVPHIAIEPDEVMDKLRQRALRWAIFRDVIAVCVGAYLLSMWVIIPGIHALFG